MTDLTQFVNMLNNTNRIQFKKEKRSGGDWKVLIERPTSTIQFSFSKEGKLESVSSLVDTIM